MAKVKNPMLGGGGGAPPELKRNQIFDDIGTNGLRAFSGYVREELLPQLSGRQEQAVYREMLDNSPTVGAIMFAITQAMRKVTWRVESAGEIAGNENKTKGGQRKGKGVEEAEFVESLMEDMGHTWDDFINESLTFLGYGFSAHEIVYKRRLGPRPEMRPGPKNPTDIASSKFNDGKIGWRRLPGRGQDTILKWFFDVNGGIRGFTQQPYAGTLINLPIEKCLLFRASTLKNNPQGKALDPETLIPTPDGWRKLDDLGEGDKVFDETGRIRYVTARADWEDRPCYRVTFGDGNAIIADENHEWLTETLHERSRRLPGEVRTTANISAYVKTAGGVANHSIPWAAALDYPEQILPVDPYVLGLWLGDGHSRAAMVTCHADDLEETCALIEAAGYPVEHKHNGVAGGLGRLIRFYGAEKWASDGPTAALRVLGVLENKHIPAAYLRGSVAQRRALLAGLMDSDGYVNPDGGCEFCNTNANLAFGVAELVRSLGIGARLTSKINSHGTPTWLVKFTPTWPPFRLSRKASKCRTERQRTRHFIHAVERVESRRTVCIEVDSPSHLFLAGEGMVPTHNSILRNAYVPWYYTKRLQELEAISVERMNGFPVIYVPSELIDRALATNGTGPADAQAASTYAAIKKMATNIRVDEQMGAVFPSDTFADAEGKPSSVRMYELQFLTPQHGAGGKTDIDKVVNRYKVDIMTTVLADFIQMGHEVRGTNNLAVTKVDMFYQAIEAWLNAHAAVLNRIALPRLWKLNGFDDDLMPRFVPDMAQRLDLDSLGTYVANLSAAGMPMFPDEDLQTFLREAGGMPGNTDPAAMKAAADTLAASLQPKIKTGVSTDASPKKGKSKTKSDNVGANG